MCYCLVLFINFYVACLIKKNKKSSSLHIAKVWYLFYANTTTLLLLDLISLFTLFRQGRNFLQDCIRPVHSVRNC